MRDNQSAELEPSPQERRERDEAWWRYHYGVNNLAEWEARMAAALRVRRAARW